MPTTFKVNDVVPRTKLLPQATYGDVVQHRCGSVRPEAFSPPQGRAVKELEGLDRLIGIDHGLVSAVHAAWSSHYPLVLSPDALWLCIAQGLARHINVDDNAEKLRHLFVEHEGKKTLTVQRDDFVKGSPHNAWPAVFDSFAEEIRRNVGDNTFELLTPAFTTTGPVERAAAQIVMMDCFKQYFEYSLACICGIPEITLEGTPEDWMALREKALALADYDLGWWVDALRPILDQFVEAATGNVDREFWCKIYHHYGGSAYDPGPYITGWILAFFPYAISMEGKAKQNPFLNLWQKKNPSSHKLKGGMHVRVRALGEESDSDSDDDPNVPASEKNKGLTHDQFPPGVVSTPFTWEFPTVKYPMYFYAGFMAVTQDRVSKAIRTEIGWAVADNKTLETAKQRHEQTRPHWLDN